MSSQKETISILVDAELKEQASRLYQELGIDLETAVTLFLKQSVREKRLPFQPSLENPETFQVREDVLTGENLSLAFNNLEDLRTSLNED